MERNIKLTLMYDGSPFHGWQMQENAVTVQGCLTEAAERIFGHKITIQGCSRTDAGVHANTFCCNFKTEKEIPCEKIKVGLNALVPESMVVLNAEEAPLSFNARFDCKGKEYIYKIWNSRQRNPFLVGKALHYPYPLDCKLLNEEAKSFLGYHDFSSFCASGSVVKDTRRTVYDCRLEREGDLVIFHVTGDGFLYNMVRIMVGTLLSINSGKIEKGTIPEIISSGDRVRAGITAKAQGLYLNKVFYDEIKY